MPSKVVKQMQQDTPHTLIFSRILAATTLLEKIEADLDAVKEIPAANEVLHTAYCALESLKQIQQAYYPDEPEQVA
jgi:hypothetical protein